MFFFYLSTNDRPGRNGSYHKMISRGNLIISTIFETLTSTNTGKSDGATQ